MVERASQPRPIITCVRFGAALDRETLPPLASVTPMMLVLPKVVRAVVKRVRRRTHEGAAPDGGAEDRPARMVTSGVDVRR
ncbi:hypothetical protein SAV14893_053960 [Streptomyces avermitilis]|uniref:Uncharacterized protein n=1 Tax=Streptomyces avermitilis TaxID=33903 RepID=A0A4D4M2F7_STRAX|nr:hypothetical protein SAVMC3_66230 [Streptomyces avermitilis]GDY66003.1 hypothetical protein SAV14893_053960 [Streptomyces avermitilis]GDY73777.1 hypothetical protein SAV31267_032620 [Streptomyces avermitilis]GDY82859.1 hypothetical protein SAVCW2_20580 [Streptomyces avermitilis]